LVENDARVVDVHVIPESGVAAVAAEERRLDDRLATDVARQLPEDELPVRGGLGEIESPDEGLGFSPVGLEVGIEAVVPFPGEYVRSLRRHGRLTLARGSRVHSRRPIATRWTMPRE
jgi:hypothetical protein